MDTEGDLVWRGPNGEILDETKSVKVGLDREELMAEFAILAEEEREEAERAQAVFVEAVQNLKLYSQLDVETISNLLTVLEDSGRDEGVAWEYFFQQGAHQVLLVLLNAPEIVEDQRRTDQILRMWERIARFVFKLSAEDQAVVYEELRRQGMVETLALAMKHHPQHPPILRRAAFLLAQLFGHDAPDAPPSDHDPSALHRMRASDGLVSLFSAMEAQPDIYSPDLLVKVRGMREALEGKKSTSPPRQSEDAAAAREKEEKEEEEKEEEEEKRAQQEREQREAEAKQAQDMEHVHKQQADRKLTAAERARMHEAALDAAPGPTEKAPLLAAHAQRHAAGQVVTGDGCCSACVLM